MILDDCSFRARETLKVGSALDNARTELFFFYVRFEVLRPSFNCPDKFMGGIFFLTVISEREFQKRVGLLFFC